MFVDADGDEAHEFWEENKARDADVATRTVPL